MGFMRYGLHERAQQLARAQFEAAELFDFHRLPELFSGHPRDDDHPFPALYPNANSPQAWSASTVFLLLQSMLGLYPYAPLNVLLVDPHLPEWLPEYTVRDLRVGKARVTIRFTGTSWQVLEKEGKLHVVHQPLPWSLTATKRERLFDLIKSLVK
jgi:glycogen debranching enzyme